MFTIVFALNMIAIVVSCTHYWGYAENNAAAFALGNITAAVACRNEFFLRYFVYWPLVKLFQKVINLSYVLKSCINKTVRSGLRFGGASSSRRLSSTSVVSTLERHAVVLPGSCS